MASLPQPCDHLPVLRPLRPSRGATCCPVQPPGCGGWSAAVMGVDDKADHGSTHRGNSGRKRQMTEHPLQARRRFWSGMAVPGEVEICPPGTEADHDGDQPDAEG